MGWGIPDPGWSDGPVNARKATLWDVIEDTGAKTLHYLYDFGDGWEHTVKLLAIDDGEADAKHPRLPDAKGRCPPEDIGGPWGYGDFLEAIEDPNHERHEEFIEWYPADFNPNDTRLEGLKAAVADLAKRWNRKSRKKKLLTRGITGRTPTFRIRGVSHKARTHQFWRFYLAH